MSFTNAKFLLLVLLLSVMQATLSKKVLLRKGSATSTGPISDFSAFWALTKEWTAVFSGSKTLARQIRSDLAVNGNTPVESWDKEMTTLFKQNPPFADSKWNSYWIVKTNGHEGKNVSKREAEVDVQNGIVSLNFFEMFKKTYTVGASKYADKVKQLVSQLAKTDNTVLSLSTQYFKLADTDKSGDVSPAEFKAAFGPIIPSGVNLDKLFKDFDHDKNGTLSQEEIGHVMGKILSLNVPDFYRP